MAKEMTRIGRKYYLSLKHGTSRRSDMRIEAQARNYWRGYEPVHIVDGQIREMLMERGVSMLQYVAFANFGRQVGRLCRNHRGRTLALEVAALMRRYERQGLSREVLLAICREVFELEVP